MLDIETIAEVCHEANRAYCATLGDVSQKHWTQAEHWQKESARNGVKHHLTTLNNGGDPQPHESHESWLKEKLADGWTYGEKKDPDKKEHPCCVAYEQLPQEQKLKDFLFVGIVKAFFFAERNGK